MKHFCHYPGCKVEVPPRLWGCAEHWSELPLSLKTALLKSYRKGQEVNKKPSLEYLEAALAIRRFVKTNSIDIPEDTRSEPES